jgi:hypothetical protein
MRTHGQKDRHDEANSLFAIFQVHLKIKTMCFGNMIGALSYAFLLMFCLELLHDMNIKQSVEKAKVE